MISDWLKTQKKPLRTNQIRAVLTTKFNKMTMVFSRHKQKKLRRLNRKVKNALN